MQFVEKEKKKNKTKQKQKQKQKKKEENKRKAYQSGIILGGFALHYRVKDQSALPFSVIREKTKLAQSRLDKFEDSALSIISQV